MIRNLLYSLSLHLLIMLLLYSNTILYKPQKALNIDMDVIEKTDKDLIKKISRNLPANSNNKRNIANLSINDKLKLYEKLDKLKKLEISSVNYNDFKNYVKQNASLNSNKTNTQPISDTSSTSIVVEKESHKVYVEEKNFTNEQIVKIEEQNKRKEKIREKILENSNTEQKIAEKETKTFDNLVEDLDKPIKTVDSEIDNEINPEQKNNLLEKVDIQNEEMNELASLLGNDGRDEIERLEKILENEDKIENIFTKEDYEKLANSQDSKTNSIYELTFREKLNIQRQIKTCYKNAIMKTRKNSPLAISTQISLSQNGQINLKNVVFNIENESNINNIDDNDYNIAVNNVKLTLIYCNPLRNLPKFKYNIWKNMNLIFNY